MDRKTLGKFIICLLLLTGLALTGLSWQKVYASDPTVGHIKAIQFDGLAMKINNVNIVVYLKDENNNVLKASGATKPTNGSSGYCKGCMFIKTNGGAGTTLYFNEGSTTSCTFNVPAGTADLTPYLTTAIAASQYVSTATAASFTTSAHTGFITSTYPGFTTTATSANFLTSTAASATYATLGSTTRFGVTTGTAPSYSLTVTAPVSTTAGNWVMFKAHATSTSTVITLAVNSLTANHIAKQSDLTPATLLIDSIYTAISDGVKWIIQGE